MAHVTAIGSDSGQVNYRLGLGHGCTPEGIGEARFSYHADGRERPLRWVGSGLEALGIEPGLELTPEQFDTARALMAGRDPRTDEILVAPKLAVFDDAKVPLRPLVDAVRSAAGEREVGIGELFAAGKDKAAIARAERALTRFGDGARLRADEAGHLAECAGLDPRRIWKATAYETALGYLTHTVRVTQPDGTRVSVQRPRREVVGTSVTTSSSPSRSRTPCSWPSPTSPPRTASKPSTTARSRTRSRGWSPRPVTGCAASTATAAPRTRCAGTGSWSGR